MKDFSVIVPAYNSEKTLDRCLESLMHQSMDRSRYEVILVDDGSTDQTSSIAKAHDIKYHYQANTGPAGARNNGASLASGAIILFTDSDCEPDHFWLESMTRPFLDPEVSGVKGAYKTLQKEITARFAQAEFKDRFELLKKSDSIDMVDTYSAAFRKSVFIEAGGFDLSFPVANNEDTDLSYRLASSGHRLVFNPDAIVYHTHPDTLKKYLKLKYSRGYWRIIVYARFPEKAIKDSYTPQVIKIQSLLMAGFFALTPFYFFSNPLQPLALLIPGAVMGSALPFAITVFKADRVVGILSPVFCLLRAAVFALGSLHGALHLFKKKLQ